MAEPATKLGPNRTGIQASPFDAKELEEIISRAPANAPEMLKLNEFRQQYVRQADGIGSVPAPGTLKGMATSAIEMIQGHKPTVFIDKLGERLAFERAGTRAYESVLMKFDALGSWEGGPTRDLLKHQHNEELSHFHMVTEIMEGMGADPTAMTPSADLTAVAGSGPLKIITTAKTTLPQCLHALLLLEGADVEGWTLLIKLADEIGQDKLAGRFREAHQTEETHQERVRSWLAKAISADAQHELGEQGTSAS